jgi:hypothetical protein
MVGVVVVVVVVVCLPVCLESLALCPFGWLSS